MTMKMTKGNEPTSKKGGMKAHLAASPGNNPTASRSVNTGFSGKAGKHMGASKSIDARKSRPSLTPGCGHDGSK